MSLGPVWVLFWHYGIDHEVAPELVYGGVFATEEGARAAVEEYDRSMRPGHEIHRVVPT
jgi:hypothetical protein